MSDSFFGGDFRVKWDCVRWRIQASSREALSLMVSESAATKFSLAISESIGTLCNDESTRQLWKHYRWWFWVGRYSVFDDDFRSTGTMCAEESRLHLWRQSHWWFLSRQRLPFHLRFRSLQGIFAPTNVGISSDSLIISGSSAAQYSVTITESTGTVRTDESTLHLGKLF